MKPLDLHIQYIRRDEENQFVVLPVSDFEALIERVEDLTDLADLREAELEDQKDERISLDQVRHELGLDRGEEQSAA